jgi:hypothetical protein
MLQTGEKCFTSAQLVHLLEDLDLCNRRRPKDQSLNPFDDQSQRRSSGSTIPAQGGPDRIE